MAFRQALRWIAHLTAVQSDKPELLKAQLVALSRLIPLLYFILIANVWVLSVTFSDDAPQWLTVDVAAVLSIICGIRLVLWWQRKPGTLSDQDIVRELRRTNGLAATLGAGFSLWSLALFSYGDDLAKAHIAFFMTIAMLGSMMCLIHLRSAALIVAATVGIPFAIFFASTGIPDFIAMAVNVMLVTVAVVIVILVKYSDFTRMVEARQHSEALGSENLRLANLDSLTELPNRRAFFSHLHSTFDAARSDGARLALGIIDLDGFKPVNDLYGHLTGDRLLVEVASRLSGFFSPRASIFLARLGGDEFAYVVKDAKDDSALLTQGEETASLLRVPFAMPEATVQIAGSVGIATYPDNASSAMQLFEHADYALYHGKGTRRGGAVMFSAAHEAQINSASRIEQALKLADLEQELTIAFQPIVDVKSQLTIGFEALARWNSPVLGRVSPGQFIPVAERAGIISSLTRTLLKKALVAALPWPNDLRLSFNLSTHDLNTPEHVLAVVAIIQGSGFDARRLDIEITETAFAHDFEQVEQSVEMLRRLGCGISLDDFGTGYSSLSRLHALPLTKIKVDRSFVTGLHKNRASHKIVKSLLALSKDMGLDCVVEGVETQEELATLRKLGGSLVQGYLYSPPITEDEIPAFLGRSENNPLRA